MKRHLKTTLLVAASFVGLLVVRDAYLKETLLLNSDVDQYSIGNMVEEITNDLDVMKPLMTTRIIINSPGGFINQLNLFRGLKELQQKHIITEIPSFAASAASDIFLLGDERKINRKATILFHEVRLGLPGGLILTYTDAKSILTDSKLGPNSSLAGKRLPSAGSEMADMLGLPKKETFDGKTIVDDIKKFLGGTLGEQVLSMEKTHNEHIAFVIERTGLSREVVLTKLLRPNEDITLTAKQALELNVATEIV